MQPQPQVIDRARNAAIEVDDDMMFRAATVDVSGLNEESRTITATISTEQPVPMYDYRNGRMIDEVLVARGGSFPSQIPLLDNHSRWGTGSVLGSGRSITLAGDRWRSVLHFARDAGDQVEQVWQLVRQGHVTDVSIGYRYEDNAFVDIPAGQSREVAGRMWTAKTRTLRVVTQWTGREVSTTPIGADDQAKIGRSRQHKHIERGIGSEGSINFSAESNGSASRSKTIEETMEPVVTPETSAATETRTESAATTAQTSTTTAERSSTALQPQSADQIRAERERVAYIYQQRGSLPDELVDRAICEQWDTTRVNTEFAAARRQPGENGQPQHGRTPPVSAQAPAGHVVNRSMNLQTLQAAMLQRHGISPDSQFLRAEETRFALSAREARADWITSGIRSLDDRGNFRDETAARAWDQAYRMRNISLVEMCREALDLEGVQYDRYDTQDMLQRAFSTASLNAIFTTNFNAQMMEGFMGIEDTTRGWTGESQMPNFLTAERIQGHKFSRLRKVDRNQEIKDASVQAVYESYKLARYAEQFVVDEMDIIDDRFGMLNMAPQDMGEAAGELRPDLVYAILLQNPTMGQDSKALFHTDHGNFTASGAALSSQTLAARKSAMKTQTSNGRLLNIQPRHLIVPETSAHKADVLVGSAERRDTTSSTEYGTKNWAQGKFNVVSEPRLDAGLVDPSTETAVAGQAGSWFLAADRGRYGIEVGYLRGTGGVPVIRRFQLDSGKIGVGWLVIMYVAAKAIGYQGLACSKA